MYNKKLPLVALAALLLPQVAAAFNWNEAVDGDLSGDRFNPTVLSAAPGSNLLAASTASGDLEYFTFAVPAGFQFSLLNLVSYSGDDQSFAGVQDGTQFTMDPASSDPSQLKGWSHFATADIGGDILADMGAGPGAQGFVPPLPAGDYVFWLQETGASTPVEYQMDFVLTAVPLPAAAWLFGGALALLGALRRPGSRTLSVTHSTG